MSSPVKHICFLCFMRVSTLLTMQKRIPEEIRGHLAAHSARSQGPRSHQPPAGSAWGTSPLGPHRLPTLVLILCQPLFLCQSRKMSWSDAATEPVTSQETELKPLPQLPKRTLTTFENRIGRSLPISVCRNSLEEEHSIHIRLVFIGQIKCSDLNLTVLPSSVSEQHKSSEMLFRWKEKKFII